VTDAAPEVSAQERRALWAEVLRWPLRGGMLGGVVLFTALAYASASCEGGWAPSERDQRAMTHAAVIFAAVLALAVYAWRAVRCTWPQERRVPWLGDDGDDTPLSSVFGTFLPVVFLSFLPMIVWLSLRGPLAPAGWVDWMAIAASGLYAGAVFPLGLAGAAVKGSALAAMPGTVRRMWRAEPHAARIAAMTGIAFMAALLLSTWLATTFVKVPRDASITIDRPRTEPVTVPAWLFAAVFVLRAAAFYAALVACRVAGLLVREVREIGEVLR
jgi:hypothetical protein